MSFSRITSAIRNDQIAIRDHVLRKECPGPWRQPREDLLDEVLEVVAGLRGDRESVLRTACRRAPASVGSNCVRLGSASILLSTR